MGRKREIKLDLATEKQLKSYKEHHTSPKVRQRCHIVLLKAQGYSHFRIQTELGCSTTTITNSIDKYEFGYSETGIKCMLNAPGQGRKSVLLASDLDMVRAEVSKERQRLSIAKAIIEENKGTKLSNYQLRTFLKSLVENTSESVKS